MSRSPAARAYIRGVARAARRDGHNARDATAHAIREARRRGYRV